MCGGGREEKTWGGGWFPLLVSMFHLFVCATTSPLHKTRFIHTHTHTDSLAHIPPNEASVYTRIVLHIVVHSTRACVRCIYMLVHALVFVRFGGNMASCSTRACIHSFGFGARSRGGNDDNDLDRFLRLYASARQKMRRALDSTHTHARTLPKRKRARRRRHSFRCANGLLVCVSVCVRMCLLCVHTAHLSRHRRLP